MRLPAFESKQASSHSTRPGSLVDQPILQFGNPRISSKVSRYLPSPEKTHYRPIQKAVHGKGDSLTCT